MKLLLDTHIIIWLFDKDIHKGLRGKDLRGFFVDTLAKKLYDQQTRK